MLTDRFEDALSYATRLHANQVRKGSGVPYVSHLLAVASLVLDYGGDEEETIAGLLHDAVEDQGGVPRLEDIRLRYGDRVADIVAGCTDSWETPKPPWRDRKENYLKHIPTASRSIRLVSCADKVHNIRSIIQGYRKIGELVWSKFRGGKDGSLWYYRELLSAFRGDEEFPILIEYEQSLFELERLIR